MSLYIELLSLKHELLLNGSSDDFYNKLGLVGEDATMSADVGGQDYLYSGQLLRSVDLRIPES